MFYNICKIAKMYCLHAFRVVCSTTYSCLRRQGRRNWGHCTAHVMVAPKLYIPITLQNIKISFGLSF